jgi:ribonucleotide reductase beta subunit family protein with ferritin-like domain
MISLEGKTNFFEQKVSEYSILRERVDKGSIFDLNSEF